MHEKYVKKEQKVKLHLPREKLTMNETLIFLKIVPLAFKMLILPSFAVVEVSLKFYFWYKPSYFF